MTITTDNIALITGITLDFEGFQMFLLKNLMVNCDN